MSRAEKALEQAFDQGFRRLSDADAGLRRIGAELKFPLVDEEGVAASREALDALWQYLDQAGWRTETDPVSGKIIGARTEGPYNDTVASCETGYCKTEFSLAHVGDLFELDRAITGLKELLLPFMERQKVHFLAYGIQPRSAPGSCLIMKKSRSSVWDRAFPSNRVIPSDQGDDVHLFTVNAGSHVHVSLPREEAVRAVNVLNGFAPAQIALGANSSIWKGRIDAEHRCVNERFWDWWIPAEGRVGVPERPFADLADYARTVAGFPPVYVKRDGTPYLLPRYRTFAEYFDDGAPVGNALDGGERPLTPEEGDLALHNSCYWFNARISQYFTVENRVFDQQPPDTLCAPAAVTLGLASALAEAWDVLSSHTWSQIRLARVEACRNALQGGVGEFSLLDFSREMLNVAHLGLKRRGLGEESFLEPLFGRVERGMCPALSGEAVFSGAGFPGLIEETSIGMNL